MPLPASPSFILLNILMRDQCVFAVMAFLCVSVLKRKVHTVTCHEDKGGVTLALDSGGWSTPRPGRFTRGNNNVGGWVGPMSGLDG